MVRLERHRQSLAYQQVHCRFGTNRLLKVVQDPKSCVLPRNLAILVDAGNKIYADFVVRPVTPFQPGVMQDVCVAGASIIRTEPDPLLRTAPH